MTPIIFFIAAIGAIAGAVGVITLKNPFYAVLSLVGHLLSLALLFLLLRAEFVAAAQIVVYAGAVMVLYVFVVAYVGDQSQPLRATGGPALNTIAAVGAGALLLELLIAVLGTGLKAVGHDGAHVSAGFGSPEQIGELLLTRFLFAFETASFLLLVAAVGAVMLARRRRGLTLEDEEVSAPPMTIRPVGTGTMAEGVGIGSGTIPTPDPSTGLLEPVQVGKGPSGGKATANGSGGAASHAADGPRNGEQGGGW